MAIVNGYATLAELQERSASLTQGYDGAAGTTELERVIEVASRDIDSYCDRHFFQTDAATVRYVARPSSGWWLPVPDLVHGSITAVEIDIDDTDSWTAYTDYEVDPYPGDLRSGVQWPVERLHSLGSRLWPTGGKHARRVRVTATWGWAAVPRAVNQATLELAAQRAKSAEAPFGVAGFNDYGAVRITELKSVQRMLYPYMRNRAMVG
ncbi:MAG: hypothetical protein GY925_20710 [Actinomycetia bacterium]|nr:hypothetical protein [Actinomycetes bacterium]